MATIIPFPSLAERILRKRSKAVLNTRLFNLHDILVIGLIVVIIHIVARPLFQAVGSSPASTTDAAG